ncbi:MAG: hypothetical protein HY554_17370 [Elusimicrobia bacterium]|nr:hypothetical protein [Elusimicrobiota bacterium]
MSVLRALLCWLSLGAPAARADAEASWASQETLHFAISHERLGFSRGDHNRIDRIYEALQPELWRLVPWMSQEKTRIYLYKDQESYLQGRFKPPAWSGGLFLVSAEEKALALYEPVDTEVAAHELTHLYLHTYFREKERSPPPWLDEGLAAMLQNEALGLPDPRDKGPVLSSPLPVKDLLRSRPESDAPRAWVGAWYQQAHSVVRFLRRAHIEESFAELCGRIRKGEDAGSALKGVYGYADLAAFEAAWLAWRPRKPLGQPLGLDDQ